MRCSRSDLGVIVATPERGRDRQRARLCGSLSGEDAPFFRGCATVEHHLLRDDVGHGSRSGDILGLGIGRSEGVQLYGMAMENPKEGAVPAGKTMFNCALSEAYAANLDG